MISTKVTNRPPDVRSKVVSNIDSNSQINSTFYIHLGNEPLRPIWLCAIDHCGKLAYALRATAGDLGKRYGTLRRIWLCAMGHCGGFSHALRATAADLVMRFRPLCWWSPIIKFYDDIHAVGHSAGFSYALWAIARNLVMRYRLWCRILLCAMSNSVGFC
jgi:hypothetical protein